MGGYVLWAFVSGGPFDFGSGQASTSVRPERSGAESKGWGRGCAVLRLCSGSTGGEGLACPFGLVYAGCLPIWVGLRASFDSAALRSGRTDGVRSGCAEGGASLRMGGGGLRLGWAGGVLAHLGWLTRFLRLRCTPLRTNGWGALRSGPSTRLRMLGMWAAQDARRWAAPSLFVSPVKTWRGLTSVRPERSGAESKGWALRRGSGQALRRGSGQALRRGSGQASTRLRGLPPS